MSHWQELQLPCIPNQELATCEELLWLEGTGKEPAFSYKALPGTKYEWCFTNTEGERGTEMVVQPAGSAQPAHQSPLILPILPPEELSNPSTSLHLLYRFCNPSCSHLLLGLLQ